MFVRRWLHKRRVRDKRPGGRKADEAPTAERGSSAKPTGEQTAGIISARSLPQPSGPVADADAVTNSTSNRCVVQPTPRQRSNLCNLPDELLLRIVSFIYPLDKTFMCLKLTCKRLHAITEDPTLYQLTTLTVPSRCLFSFAVLQRVLDVSGEALIGLDLSGCEDITNYTLFRIAAHCGKLKRLSLSRCKQITNGGLKVIGSYLTQLQELDVSFCPFITCAGVVHLFKMIGRTLVTINLNDCLGFREDPHRLVSLAFFCSSLRHLSVGWSRDLVKLNPLLDMDLDRLTQGCTQLEYLDVSHSHSTNGSMQSIARNCPVLTTLIARQCFLQDTGLEHIGQGMNKLEWLDLTDCWYVTDAGLGSVASGCPRLRVVILTRCHEIRGTGVVKVAAGCLQLEKFVLKQCFRVDDHAIECLGLSAQRLRHLDLSCNQNVTVETVRKIREARGGGLSIVTDGCPRVPRGGAASRFLFSKNDSNCLMVWETAV
ncbi:F-box/LRR-repeat protein 2-like [Acanthaster planci]|uniref:F-box/LRR-repeat protein 2-like n=1 Tax=Acanthaster planci TaxID=133434 RepID=A0A8B7Y5U9_ACAPL|nr:F-box/LRR-repeat protein 2-like [Acanthaster planci]